MRSSDEFPIIPAYDMAEDFKQCSEFSYIAEALREAELLAKKEKSFNNLLKKLKWDL
jgi:hypothetical protein